MTQTTYLTVHHVGESVADRGPWAVVEVTTPVEQVAGPFPTKRAAEKWLENDERQEASP